MYIWLEFGVAVLYLALRRPPIAVAMVIGREVEKSVVDKATSHKEAFICRKNTA